MQAQENGVPEAALALGDMAARTPASRDKAANEKIVQSALSWYEAAAKAGVPSAQFKLANAYFAGVGVPRDPAQAHALVRPRRAAGTAAGPARARHHADRRRRRHAPIRSRATSGCCWPRRAAIPDSRVVREKAAEQIAEADRKRAEALAQRFVPTLRAADRRRSGGARRLPRPPSGR